MIVNDNGQKLSETASKGLLRRIASTFKPYWPKISVVGVLILITAGFGVVNPVLIRVVFDDALFPKSGVPDLNLLWIVAGVMAAVTVFTGGPGHCADLFY